MSKHKIAYIDESRDEIMRFQRQVYESLDVEVFYPKEDMDFFIEELLNSGVEAFVSDFHLGHYREDVNVNINYTGGDLIERLLAIRERYPCFVLTSFDNDAVERMNDVNYVYSKQLLTDTKQVRIFIKKVIAQIEHYSQNINDASARFFDLLDRSANRKLTEEEENQLLELDSFLERTLSQKSALPKERKNQLVIEEITKLLSSTNDLIQMLRENRKE